MDTDRIVAISIALLAVVVAFHDGRYASGLLAIATILGGYRLYNRSGGHGGKQDDN